MEENNINNTNETGITENVNTSAESVETNTETGNAENANATAESTGANTEAGNSAASNNMPPIAPIPTPQQQPQKSSSTYGTISLVLGIVGIIMSCCFSWIGLILSIAAIVLAILDKRNNPSQSQNGKIGFILGCVGIGLFVVSFVLGLILGSLSVVTALFEEMGM